MRRLLVKKLFVLAAVGVVAVVLNLSAQQAEENLPPRYPGTNTRVPGVFITPIAGEPFSATVEVVTDVVSTDGTWSSRRTMNKIARDSSGRIHNERRLLVPESFRGEPRVLEVHIFDPVKMLNVFYDPMTHVATQRVLSEMPKAVNAARPGAKVEDLGMQTLAGVETRGLRYSVTIPAQVSGTGQSVEITDEYWYSEELRLNILVQHHDPRTGLQSVGIIRIDREEPPASLFEIPDGYKVVDVTPPPGANRSANDSITH
jgi:hypothetical protein